MMSRHRRSAPQVFAAGATVLVVLGSGQAVADASADTTVTDYSSLQAAFEAGGTITLANDITEDNRAGVAVGSDKHVTLDLHGHALSITAPASGPAVGVFPGTSLLIEDATGTAGSRLVANGAVGGSGIGGGKGGAAGAITVLSGTVVATGGSGAGIGGGGHGVGTPGGAGGTVTILGGSVSATGGASSAGIGGGDNGAAGTVTVQGGSVSAIGGYPGMGIGGGARRGPAGAVSVSGGSVFAMGSDSAGIGGNSFAVGGTVSVSGGTVTAIGGRYNAGIGGADEGAPRGTPHQTSGQVSVSGGSVYATGGFHGAGIGSGEFSPAGTVIVSGGTVSATGGMNAAGIGGGFDSAGGSMIVEAGSVTATGGEGGAGVGGGLYGSGGAVEVNSGGSLSASSGPPDGVTHKVSAIGHGGVGPYSPFFGSLTNAGSLTIAGAGGLVVPTGVSVLNTGTMTLHSRLSGNGTVTNDGVIFGPTYVAGNGQRSPLVSGRNYTLLFDDGTAPSPAPLHVYAGTVRNDGERLPAPTSLPAGARFDGWYTRPAGGSQVSNATDLTQLLGAGPVTSTVYAHVTPLPSIVGTPPAATVGTGYSFTFEIDDQTPSVSATGALPPGLTLTRAGVLSGIPTVVGSYRFSVSETNSRGSATEPVNMVVNPD